ncbi:MAG: hypothetical protein PHP50_04840 [Lachnospiraceae bacterium]|nr:hypothetical protein [Lachnospiraceae bacterium]
MSKEKVLNTSVSNQKEQKTVHQIYDKILKRILSLSNLAIINLINGLFGTNHPLDSTVSFPRSKFTSITLTGRFADVLIVIAEKYHYHLEAQTVYDGMIVLRVFEYGALYAIDGAKNGEAIRFPEPVVIYLKGSDNIPEKSSIKIEFGGQGSFVYEVKNYVYNRHSLQELNQRKMIILIPFHLLKLQDLIEKEPSKENLRILKELIEHDILNSIEANRQCGNISDDDSKQLCLLTEQLYQHIYAHYEELGGGESMRFILPGALELPTDKLEMKIEEQEKKIAENEKILAEKEKALAEQEQKLAAKDQELEALRKQLAAMQKQK